MDYGDKFVMFIYVSIQNSIMLTNPADMDGAFILSHAKGH